MSWFAGSDRTASLTSGVAAGVPAPEQQPIVDGFTACLHDRLTANDPDVVPATCHGDQNAALAASGRQAVKADFIDVMRRTTWVAAGLIALTFLLGYLLPRTARPEEFG